MQAFHGAELFDIQETFLRQGVPSSFHFLCPVEGEITGAGVSCDVWKLKLDLSEHCVRTSADELLCTLTMVSTASPWVPFLPYSTPSASLLSVLLATADMKVGDATYTWSSSSLLNEDILSTGGLWVLATAEEESKTSICCHSSELLKLLTEAVVSSLYKEGACTTNLSLVISAVLLVTSPVSLPRTTIFSRVGLRAFLARTVDGKRALEIGLCGNAGGRSFCLLSQLTSLSSSFTILIESNISSRVLRTGHLVADILDSKIDVSLDFTANISSIHQASFKGNRVHWTDDTSLILSDTLIPLCVVRNSTEGSCPLDRTCPKNKHTSQSAVTPYQNLSMLEDLCSSCLWINILHLDQ